MKKILLFLLLLPCAVHAQKYPRDYFRNPLNIPILLAGNFGECRGGHFHSGLDIKTGGKENLPVFSAAEGYISRIKMDKGGFGHALYITHPNGYTTLYAHLNNFVPKLQNYLRVQQYKAEKWDLDLQLDPTQFPVNKGEQVAYSGNTGSSTAPHLHFEIRDSKTEHPLNPMLFGLKVVDNKPPVPLELAIYDLRKSIYAQSPMLIPVKKAGAAYIIKDGKPVISTSTTTGIGIHVNDYMNGSENTLNFYTARLYVNDVLVTGITLDDIGYDVTRYMHAYADYKTKEQKDKWIQLLFRLKGNKLEHLYTHEMPGTGAITMAATEEAPIKIELEDNNGNIATIEFTLRVDNVSGDGPQRCDAAFKAGTPNSFDDLNVAFALPETALYDDVCFNFSKKDDGKAYSSVYEIGKAYIPIHNYFDLGIKPEKTIPFDLRNKVAMIYSDGKNKNGRAATSTDKGWYSASVRNFGTYSLIADITPPVITPATPNNANLSKAKRASFTIKDATTSIKKYSAQLDGKWIVLEQHGDRFFYEFDSRCPKGKRILTVTATDENDNSQTLRYNFIR
jgi:hypothetical protein